jgi:two-component system sensor histidine kinase KdpD
MSPFSRRRRLIGHALALGLPALLTLALVHAREPLNLVSDMLLFVLVAVIVALVGGLLPAVVAAVSGSVLLNYYFTPPFHTFTIEDPNNTLALLVFILVAVLVSSSVDLAARRRARLDEAAAEATALTTANELRTALLAAVGHDLRTPLSAAKAAVSSLRSDAVSLSPEESRELLADADASIDRLGDLIANLLDMSRLRVGAVSMRREPTDTVDVINRARRHLGDERERVTVEAAPDQPQVQADPGLLERVIANLLTNALRWSDGPVVVRCRSNGGWSDIQVIDDGPGVPSADHERIFAAFQHGGDFDTNSGLGLGLAVARGLTEAMGGTLTPSSTKTGGLTMTISLDDAVDSVPAEPGHRERHQGAP